MVTWQPGYVVSVRETGTNKGSLGSASFSRNQSGGSAVRVGKKHIHFSPTEAVASKDTFLCILVIISTNRYKLKTNLSAKEVKHPIHG